MRRISLWLAVANNVSAVLIFAQLGIARADTYYQTSTVVQAATEYTLSIGSNPLTFSGDSSLGLVSTTAPSISATTGNLTESDAYLVGNPDGTYTPTVINWQGDATATATVSASAGSLHASASATYSLSPFAGTLENCRVDSEGNVYCGQISLPNPIFAGAAASAQAAFQDEIQVTSATLAPSTPVDLQVVLAFDGTTASGTDYVCDAVTDSDDNPYYATQGLSFNCGGASGTEGTDFVYGVETDTPGPDQSASTVEDLSAYIGETLYVYGAMAVTATVPNGACGNAVYIGTGGGDELGPDLCGQQSSEELANDTGSIYIDPIGSSSSLVSIISDSGHDYGLPAANSPTTVPEPPSLALLAAALAGLGFCRRHSRNGL